MNVNTTNQPCSQNLHFQNRHLRLLQFKTYFYNLYVDKKLITHHELFANEALSLKIPTLNQKMSL